mmetsp:Transcript_43899/g.73112  ORF Transcript_43899/g.73112 Transcript_43899/m.73112 type:complete len:208 (+) Transcript_43899:620-1243(+)
MATFPLSGFFSLTFRSPPFISRSMIAISSISFSFSRCSSSSVFIILASGMSHSLPTKPFLDSRVVGFLGLDFSLMCEGGGDRANTGSSPFCFAISTARIASSIDQTLGPAGAVGASVSSTSTSATCAVSFSCFTESAACSTTALGGGAPALRNVRKNSLVAATKGSLSWGKAVSLLPYKLSNKRNKHSTANRIHCVLILGIATYLGG